MGMISQCRLLFTSILLGLVSITSISAVDIDKAVIEGKWQVVYDSLDYTDEYSQPIKEFLHDMACLELELDCTPVLYTSSPGRTRSLKGVMRWAKKLTKVHPRNSIPAFLLGTIYSGTGDTWEAFSHLNRAIKLDSTFAAAYLQRGMLYALNEEYELSISDYDKAIKYKPGSSNLYINRGAANDGLGQFIKSLADYATAISIDPQSAGAYYNRGNTYRHMGDDQNAIQDFSIVLGLDSTFAAAYYNRGNAHFDQGEFNEALTDYCRFIATAPEEMKSQVPVAMAMVQKTQNIISEFPEDEAEKLLLMGISELDQGDLEKARKYFDSAIELDSTRSDAYYFRAAVSIGEGNKEGAIDDFTRTVSYKPNDTTAYHNRARLLVELGRHLEALTDYSLAISLDEKYALAYLGRAESYEATGRVDSAIVDYEAFLKYSSSKETKRREQVKDLLKFLQSNSGVEGFTEAKTTIEEAYRAWANKDWKEFLNCIEQDGLKQFTEICEPIYRRINKSNSRYIAVDGAIYSMTDYRQTVLLVIRGIAKQSSQVDDLLAISFVEVANMVPRGSNRFLYRSRIVAGKGETRVEVLIEGNALKDADEWKIELPPVFFDVARTLSGAAKK